MIQKEDLPEGLRKELGLDEEQDNSDAKRKLEEIFEKLELEEKESDFKNHVIELLNAIPEVDVLTSCPSIFSGDVEAHDCDSCEASQSIAGDLYDENVCRDCWTMAIKEASRGDDMSNQSPEVKEKMEEYAKKFIQPFLKYESIDGLVLPRASLSINSEQEGWDLVTDEATQDHDGDEAGELIATIYNEDNAFLLKALWNKKALVFYYRCPECKFEWDSGHDVSICPKCDAMNKAIYRDKKARGIKVPPSRPILLEGQRELKRDSLFSRRQA